MCQSSCHSSKNREPKSPIGRWSTCWTGLADFNTILTGVNLGDGEDKGDGKTVHISCLQSFQILPWIHQVTIQQFVLEWECTTFGCKVWMRDWELQQHGACLGQAGHEDGQAVGLSGEGLPPWNRGAIRFFSFILGLCKIGQGKFCFDQFYKKNLGLRREKNSDVIPV